MKLREIDDKTKQTNIHIVRVPKGEREREREKEKEKTAQVHFHGKFFFFPKNTIVLQNP